MIKSRGGWKRLGLNPETKPCNQAVIAPVLKPDEKVYCPISKKHLRIKVPHKKTPTPLYPPRTLGIGLR